MITNIPELRKGSNDEPVYRRRFFPFQQVKIIVMSGDGTPLDSTSNEVSPSHRFIIEAPGVNPLLVRKVIMPEFNYAKSDGKLLVCIESYAEITETIPESELFTEPAMLV